MVGLLEVLNYEQFTNEKWANGSEYCNIRYGKKMDLLSPFYLSRPINDDPYFSDSVHLNTFFLKPYIYSVYEIKM